ncbi:hypothetical protein GJAV_G00105340 [Gymnothorax javanicus]|nr:hypothetical protein GJAV_G00105340 [Gymnothorax javanicus]
MLFVMRSTFTFSPPTVMAQAEEMAEHKHSDHGSAPPAAPDGVGLSLPCTAVLLVSGYAEPMFTDGSGLLSAGSVQMQFPMGLANCMKWHRTVQIGRRLWQLLAEQKLLHGCILSIKQKNHSPAHGWVKYLQEGEKTLKCALETTLTLLSTAFGKLNEDFSLLMRQGKCC